MSDESLIKLDNLIRSLHICESTDIDVVLWRHSLKQSRPTPNMMRWMVEFEQPCDRGCCWSPMCAVIRCSNCSKSLVGERKHMKRYECMACMTTGGISTSEEDESQGEGTNFTLCESCFNNQSLLHQHARNFCEIDEIGRHKRLERPVAAMPLRLLQESDFIPISGMIRECISCLVEGQMVSPAFCTRGHNSCKYVGRDIGWQECDEYMCSTCLLSFEKHRVNSRLYYCDPKEFCRLCKFEDEMANWRMEFDLECREIYMAACDVNRKNNEEASDGGGELEGALDVTLFVDRMRLKYADMMELHLQPWIQLVLKESFNSFANEKGIDISF